MRFSDYDLDTDRRELTLGTDVISLEPQVFDVLSYLALNRDRAISKIELLDEIWGSRFVSESALTSRIKSARKAVGDTGRDQRVIKTIHGHGYRFVATVDDSAGFAPIADGDSIEGIAAHLDAGRGGTWVVVGHHGPDRTDLLESIDATARAANALIGRGSSAGEGLRVFGSVIEAVDQLLQRQDGLRERLPEGVRSELESVISGNGPTTRQRLFMATREVLVVASSIRPMILILDDLEFADANTVDLISHIHRLTRLHPIVLIAATGTALDLAPEPSRITVEAHPAQTGQTSWPRELIEPIQAVALHGASFDLIEFKAATGADSETAGRLLDAVLSAGVIEVVPTGGYRFVDEATATQLVAAISPHRAMEIHLATAERLEAAGAPPDRIAEHYLASSEPDRMVAPALAAAQTAASADLHREVMRWTEVALPRAKGPDRLQLLTLRAASLVALGDPTATQTYREALSMAPAEVSPGLRAGLARATMLAGDFASAQEVLEGLEPDGGRWDGPILLAKGMYAYFTGELDTAEEAADAAREIALSPGAPSRMLDVITLQGLVAHNKGEWFTRMLSELRSTKGSPALAATIFDCHLCVAEFLLYGPTPYEEVVSLALDLRETAQTSGTKRAEAFAACVAGEAEYLAGNLDAARPYLGESIQLHRELSADSGIAHSLQRLAEVELATGNRAAAERLAREALPLARWSTLARHLVQRAYGTLIQAAPDVRTAVEVADEAEATLDDPSSCVFCQVMISVPSAIAYAEGQRLEDATRHLGLAEMSASVWLGTAWKGAVTEAKAVLARAHRGAESADHLFAEAAGLFDQAGQPLDAERCREAIGE